MIIEDVLCAGMMELRLNLPFEENTGKACQGFLRFFDYIMCIASIQCQQVKQPTHWRCIQVKNSYIGLCYVWIYAD